MRLSDLSRRGKGDARMRMTYCMCDVQGFRRDRSSDCDEQELSHGLLSLRGMIFHRGMFTYVERRIASARIVNAI